MAEPFLIKLTSAQMCALWSWTHDSTVADDVKIDEYGDAEPGTIYVAQGNARAYIQTDGTIREAGR